MSVKTVSSRALNFGAGNGVGCGKCNNSGGVQKNAENIMPGENFKGLAAIPAAGVVSGAGGVSAAGVAGAAGIFGSLGLAITAGCKACAKHLLNNAPDTAKTISKNAPNLLFVV